MSAEVGFVKRYQHPVWIRAVASVTEKTVEGTDTSQVTGDSLSAAAFDSILDAARSGVQWAWTRLLEDIDPVLRGYLRQQGAHDPDDLAGETWLHVARGVEGFDGDYQAFRSWVFMIAHHRIIDERRKRRRRPENLEEDATLDTSAPSSRSAEAEAMDSLEHDGMEALLDRLSPSQREVVLLRVIAGFGITEIAEIMGKKPGAIQALQHRAFRRLRKILQEA